MTAVVLRADARRLPLPDGCVDLICTSPPYFGLRSYTDGGEHYAGQIGSEATPAEWLASLVECTREWVRVLKPSGSIFVNLGDSYYSGKGSPGATTVDAKSPARTDRRTRRSPLDYGLDYPRKSLLGLPWRYALACMDELGLILRRDIIWHKLNSLPESVNDRCRSSHEYLFHFVKQPRYYSAIDEIREPHAAVSVKRAMPHRSPPGRRPEGIYNGQPEQTLRLDQMNNPLGRLPGSVWSIPSQPLSVPAHLGVDHFAAFPLELPRRIIAGWSPPGVCTACGEGRRPVSVAERHQRKNGGPSPARGALQTGGVATSGLLNNTETLRTITGYACACTPYTDHDGTGGHRPAEHGRSVALGNSVRDNPGGGYGNAERTGPWREYHFGAWTPPPTRPAIVLDPFAGTGTTMLAASALGRAGIGCDLSMDYARLARWRTQDRAEIAKAMQVPKPPPVMDGQEALFT